MTETMTEGQETVSSKEDQDLLREYTAKQNEVSRLMGSRDRMMYGLNPMSGMSDSVRMEKIEKEYGGEVAKAFAELQETQKKLDAKGLKAPTMEEKGI